MAKTIPQLTDATTVNAEDELIVQQGGITKRATGAELAKGLNAINEFISVKDFGAVGDGVTDDIAAFVAAADTGKHVYVPSGTYTITAANQAQAESIMAMMNRLHLFCNLLTVNFSAGQYTFSQPTNFNVANADKLRIVGAAPVTTTITSIDSVTGSSGAWVVTADVADATGIEVGDVVLVKDVEPSASLPNASNPTRPVKGALKMQFFATDSATLSLSATSGSISKTNLLNVVANNDFILADGRVKSVSSVTSNSFSVAAGSEPPKAFGPKQYWHSMQDSNRGTISVSGDTVTGVGTQFTTDANVGDLIAINSGGVRQIVSIASDTSLVLAHAHPTITTVTYGIIAAGETHDGAWVVSNVVGNKITWTNTMRRTYGPPKNLVVSGNVSCLKTNFVYSTTSGFVVDGGAYSFERLGLRGGSTTSTVGIDLRGSTSQGKAHVIASNNVGVSGFGYGCRLSSGASLQANNSFWSSQSLRGCDVAGGEARLQGAVVAGCVGIGVFAGEGAFVRLASARIHGCSLQGLRMEVGGSTWADFAVIGHNGSYNVLMVGAVNAHLVGLRCSCAGNSGIYGQNGGYGRATGALLLCNDGGGLELFQSTMECNQLISVGNESTGATISRSKASVENSAFGYNKTHGLFGLRGAIISAADESQFVGNTANGIVTSSLASILAENAGLELNGIVSASALTGGRLFIAGYGGTNSFSPTLNTSSASDSFISDQTVKTARSYTGSLAHNFGSISANTITTTTITVSGATTSDAVAIGYNGTDVAGLVVSARVSAADTVTVYAANVTTGSITVGNRTYFATVLK